jgi:hypothetical protein
MLEAMSSFLLLHALRGATIGVTSAFQQNSAGTKLTMTESDFISHSS